MAEEQTHKQSGSAADRLFRYIKTGVKRAHAVIKKTEVGLDTEEQFIDRIIDIGYPEIKANINCTEYFKSRTILAHKTEVVERINSEALARSGCRDRAVYLSTDTGDSGQGKVLDKEQYQIDQRRLNEMEFEGIPSHQIEVGVGLPLVLLFTLDKKKGLRKGTRLLVKALMNVEIEAEVLTGIASGKTMKIGRVKASIYSGERIKLVREQFPVRMCFAMTMDKYEGQGLHTFGVYMEENCLCPGRLFISVSEWMRKVKSVIIIKKANEEDYTEFEMSEDMYENMPLLDRVIRDINNSIQ